MINNELIGQIILIISCETPLFSTVRHKLVVKMMSVGRLFIYYLFPDYSLKVDNPGFGSQIFRNFDDYQVRLCISRLC